MEEILKNFGEQCDLKADKIIYKGDTRRSVNNPIVFLFIGDSTTKAYEHIKNSINKKWNNGNGIALINVSTKHIDDTDNSFNFQFNPDFIDKKSLRKDIRDKFYSDKKALEDLNNKLAMARDRILLNGNLFNSFDNVNISVITVSDDPFNIILPEITILLRNKLLEVFKLSQADLYILIKEQNMEDEVFQKAASVSFFREVEYFQKDSFKFNENIAVYGQGRELKAAWSGAVFYITYVLEEKNEKGIILEEAMVNNYDIIAYINLIKNRNMNVETYSDTQNQHYDNNIFKLSITGDNSINRYATAGLSKIKRPNASIAVSVIRAFYERIIKELDSFSHEKDEFINEILKIDEASIAAKVEGMFPKAITIEDMNGIMINSSKEIEKRILSFNLKQIEEKLYGDRCENFLYENFAEPSRCNIDNAHLETEMKALVDKNVLKNNRLSLYCAFNWTSQDGEAVKYIRDKRFSIDRFIDNLNAEIENIYNTRFAGSFGIKNFFNKNSNIKEARKKIFLDVYTRKLEVLKLNMSRKILSIYESILLKIHDELLGEIQQLNSIGETIKAYENNIIKHQNEYTAQNVRVYYTNVVNDIMDKLEKSQGEAFYLEDKYIGNLVDNIRAGNEKFLENIISFCEKYILSEEEFKKSFEEELNERANVNVRDSSSKVLSREELYRKLYNILDQNSALKIYIMNYDVKAYIEKYFFGDYSSDFIKYAFDFDKKARNYKIGYIHEIKSSGIEKLNLMGGFGAKDIIYVRKSMDFYNYCLENGYLLHGIDINLLPEII